MLSKEALAFIINTRLCFINNSTSKFMIFPAASLGWHISAEAILQNISRLGNLKLRTSYGAVGNDGISAELWKLTWKSDNLTKYSIH